MNNGLKYDITIFSFWNLGGDFIKNLPVVQLMLWDAKTCRDSVGMYLMMFGFFFWSIFYGKYFLLFQVKAFPIERVGCYQCLLMGTFSSISLLISYSSNGRFQRLLKDKF